MIVDRSKIKPRTRSWTEKLGTGGTESRYPGADADYRPIPDEIAAQRARKLANNGRKP